MKQLAAAVVAAAVIIAAGCTITTRHTIDAHITVDIRHVEEQADAILDYVEGETETIPGAPVETPEDGASLLDSAIQFLSPMGTAYAAEDLTRTSPKVKELAEKMRQRAAQIQDLKNKKVIGEDNRGYVRLYEAAGEENPYLKEPEQKNAVQKLIHEENTDRKELYKEISELYRDANMSLSTVERVYAQKRLERAKTGEIFQLPPDGPDFEAFKNSAQGKKLSADALKPNAWVVIK